MHIKARVTARFYLIRIMPVGLLMAVTLYFGNKVYLYLTVSFIQMLKACLLQKIAVDVLNVYVPFLG